MVWYRTKCGILRLRIASVKSAKKMMSGMSGV